MCRLCIVLCCVTTCLLIGTQAFAGAGASGQSSRGGEAERAEHTETGGGQ